MLCLGRQSEKVCTNADIAMHAHYIEDFYLERGPTWQAVCSSRRDSCPCLGPARTLTAGAEAEGGLRLRSRCWVPGRDSNNGSRIFHNHGESLLVLVESDYWNRLKEGTGGFISIDSKSRL